MKMKPMLLPALRGYMGDWTYYTCLMRAKDIADRVNYADEVHTNKGLSELIQRRLNSGRGRAIANYLQSNADRLFNSLVVAVYEGAPRWHEFGDIHTRDKKLNDALSDEVKYTLGFLGLDGNERLFALDGQHRLAGIKLAILKNEDVAEDEISVIFVGHSNSQDGLKRTRKLFTTLNKTAKPVAKTDIIILDESDAMAITTRRFVEAGLFQGDRISFDAQTNIRPDDRQHLTTLINLYDVLTIVLTKITRFGTPAKLRLDRPTDEVLDSMLSAAENYFLTIAKYVGSFGELLKADDALFPLIVEKYRSERGGNLLFRPIGQKIFASVVAALMPHSHSLDEAVKKASLLPLDLSADPYIHVLWNPGGGGIERRTETHTRDVLLYMLGLGVRNAETLRERRAGFLGEQSATLPPRIRLRPAATKL
jgi:DNA sulfur modification protein DndB